MLIGMRMVTIERHCSARNSERVNIGCECLHTFWVVNELHAASHVWLICYIVNYDAKINKCMELPRVYYCH